MKVVTSAVGIVRSNFAIPHMISAARFSRLVKKIEEKHKGELFGEFYDELLSYSTACVFSSIASVEAYINEFFIDHNKYILGRPEKLIVTLWETYERKSILEKYKLALLLKNNDELNTDTKEYQYTKILIKLRNALVHFKPEWDDESKSHKKLSKHLNP